MKYLKIKNSGEINPKALTLIGASTKRDNEETIGQFGSGNKFALSFLLRNGYGVDIYSGKKMLNIKLVEETFRNSSWKVININGKDTSITTDMGKDWVLWQAIREIYCNALDEGDASMELTDRKNPTEGETHFYINTSSDIMEFVSNFNYYFSETKKVLFECEYGKILEKDDNEDACIYRKGVRCFETKKKSVFDYDFEDIKINESRLVSRSWKIPELIWKIIKKCEDSKIILKLLRASGNSDFIESKMGNSIASIRSSNMSDGFKEVIKSTKLAPEEYAGLLPNDERMNHILIPHQVFDKVQDHIAKDHINEKFNTSNGRVYKEIEMKGLWEQTLRQVYDFLDEVGYTIESEVVPVQFNSKDILGAAKKGSILISDVCFEKGVNEVLNTMIEEHIHIKHGVSDRTRAMQTAIISELITYMKDRNAYAI